MSNRGLKILSLLLDYPREAWLSQADSLKDLVQEEEAFSASAKSGLAALIDELHDDVLAAQEAFVATFDRTRALSLHLFEHVHGDGKERGQAMLDLIDLYAKEGLEISSNELPDYLPIFLEYCSTLDSDFARDTLLNIVPIVRSIGQRLVAAQSPYAAVFNGLLSGLGEAELTKGHTVIQAPISSFADLDKEWEERRVEFLGAQLQSQSLPETASAGQCI